MPTMAKHTTIWHPLKTTPLSLLYYALLLHTLLSLLYYALLHIYTTLLYILCITPHTTLLSPLLPHHPNSHYAVNSIICICIIMVLTLTIYQDLTLLLQLHLHLHLHHCWTKRLLGLHIVDAGVACTCRVMLLICRVYGIDTIMLLLLLCCCWLIVVYCTPNPPPPPPIITIQLQHGSGLWEVGWGVIWITPLQSNFDFYPKKTWYKFGMFCIDGSMLQVGWYCVWHYLEYCAVDPLDVGFLCQFLRRNVEIEDVFCRHEAEAIRNSTWA
jgi:hypothetical protein